MIRFADADHVGVDGVEEDAVAAADEELALARYVIGKANARRDAVVVRGHQRGQNAFVAWESETADCAVGKTVD